MFRDNNNNFMYSPEQDVLCPKCLKRLPMKVVLKRKLKQAVNCPYCGKVIGPDLKMY